MAQVNQFITLGVGTPADIEHYTLVGLSASAEPIPPSGSAFGNAMRYESRYRAGWVYLFLFLLIKELERCNL